MIQFFISSTFKDMMQERDLVRKKVYPNIKEAVHLFGETAYFCDLRWGVDTRDMSNKASSYHVINTCLNEIDKSEYMLVFLGSRYGWQPDETLIRSIANERKLLLEDFNISVTALEIEYGALNDEDDLKRSVFYFRMPKPEVLEGAENEYYEKLNKLKNRICTLTHNRVVYYYPDTDINDNITFRLEDGTLLETKIESDLKRLINPLREELLRLSPIQRIERKVNTYISNQADKFVYGDSDLEQLSSLVSTKQCVAVFGEHGTGKTVMLCRYVRRIEHIGKVFYFPVSEYPETMGLTDFQKLITEYLESVLSLESDFEWNATKGYDKSTDELINRWKEYLSSLLFRIQFPLTIIIDGAQIIDNTKEYGIGDLIPDTLPQNVNLLISSISKPDWIPDENSFSLGNTSIEDRINVFSHTLALNSKTVDHEVLISHVAKKQNQLPLYYNLLAQRVLLFDGQDFDMINRVNNGGIDSIHDYICNIIDETPSDIGGLALNILDVLCSQISKKLCADILCVLAASLNGLREDDIACFFERSDKQWDSLAFHQLIETISDLFIEHEDGRIEYSILEIRNAAYSRYVNTDDLYEIRKRILDVLKDTNGSDSCAYNMLPGYLYDLCDIEYLPGFIEQKLTADNLSNMEVLAHSMLSATHDRNTLKDYLCNLCENAEYNGGGLNFSSFFNYQLYSVIQMYEYDRKIYVDIFHALYNYTMLLYQKYSDIQIIDDIIETCLHGTELSLYVHDMDSAERFAIQSCHCAIQLYKYKKDARRISYVCSAYSSYGNVHIANGNYTDALDAYTAAFNLLRENTDCFGEYSSSLLLLTCTKMLDAMDRCERFELTEDIADLVFSKISVLRSEVPEMLLNFIRNLFVVYSNNYYEHYDFDKAITLIVLAEDLYNNELQFLHTARLRYDMALLYHNAGARMLSEKRIDKAIEFSKKSNSLLMKVSKNKRDKDFDELISSNAVNISIAEEKNPDESEHDISEQQGANITTERIVSKAIRESKALEEMHDIIGAFDHLNICAAALLDCEHTQGLLLELFKLRSRQRILCTEYSNNEIPKDKVYGLYVQFYDEVKELYSIMPSYFPDLTLSYEDLFAYYISNNDYSQAYELCSEMFDIASDNHRKHGSGINCSNLYRYASISVNLSQLSNSRREKRLLRGIINDLISEVLDMYPNRNDIPHFDILQLLCSFVKRKLK